MFYNVFVTPTCTYCKDVVKLFVKNGIKHQLIVLENEKDIQAIKEKYNWYTVPIVVELTAEQSKFIGGYEETYKLLKERKVVDS